MWVPFWLLILFHQSFCGSFCYYDTVLIATALYCLEMWSYKNFNMFIFMIPLDICIVSCKIEKWWEIITKYKLVRIVVKFALNLSTNLKRADMFTMLILVIWKYRSFYNYFSSKFLLSGFEIWVYKSCISFDKLSKIFVTLLQIGF